MTPNGIARPGRLDNRPIAMLRDRIDWLERMLISDDCIHFSNLAVRSMQRELRMLRALLGQVYAQRAAKADQSDRRHI